MEREEKFQWNNGKNTNLYRIKIVNNGSFRESLCFPRSYLYNIHFYIFIFPEHGKKRLFLSSRRVIFRKWRGAGGEDKIRNR